MNTSTSAERPTTSAISRLWQRELTHYPKPSTRYLMLTLVAAITVLLYYQYYLAGGLATSVLRDYHMSFTFYINLTVLGYILGALASFATGFVDKYGRANVVIIGLIATSLLCLVGIPNAGSTMSFGIVFTLIGVLEGIVLVATPALIRDFSPQVGRATAMGLWAMGPVLGSLAVTQQVSNASDSMPWQDHYVASGIVGLAVAAVALLGLRELAPALRDQLMVDERDRILVEAKAKGIDAEASLARPYRQMLKPDIILAGFAISVFLIIYVAAVGLFPTYFQTVFGFSQSEANALGNWMWASQAVTLVVVGVLSDRMLVRKPFMLIGAITAIAATAVFATRATHPETSYQYFVILLSVLAAAIGVTYTPWMASFTETVERRNPALTATGLAVWGLILRLVVAVGIFIVPHIVTTVTTIVDTAPTVAALAAGKDPALTADQNAAIKTVVDDPGIGTKVQALADRYRDQLATAAKIDPATQAALAANPSDTAAQMKALSEVAGVSEADAATVLTVNAQHPQALAAGRALDPATAAALSANPTDAAAAQKAVGEVVARLGVTPDTALANLTELATIPPAQLAVVATSGPQIADAGSKLQALAQVPQDDLAYLNQYGKPLQDPVVQQKLAFLQTQGPAVETALADSPKQWQKYWWIALAGQVLFIPFIFLMAGEWSPRSARARVRAHDEMVERELARLTDREPAPVAD